MSQPDLGKLLEKAHAMQARLAAAQRELAARRVEASAGGGMVTAVATGDLRIADLHIEPAVFESGDRTLLQDLVTAAVNAALARAQQMVQEELQRLALAPGPPAGAG
ncbi:MAG: YbaB/EbfC family nucleoid-associated protein [Deltaproteobacteria bacterium]|nr:YbaB/EbfC family nucleoid-associated protein [Deltaproteobacteria bacterium]